MSSDNSPEIVFSFDDKRIKYFRAAKHTTLYEARNNAISKCKGDLITFLDCDDLWYKNKLKLQIELYNKTNSIVYGKYNIIDNKNNFIKITIGTYYSGFVSSKLLKNNPFWSNNDSKTYYD